eukprot:139413_1
MPRRKNKRNKRAPKKPKKIQSNPNSFGLKEAIGVFLNTIYGKNVKNDSDHSAQYVLRDKRLRGPEYAINMVKKSLRQSTTNINERKIDYFLDVVFIILQKYKNESNDMIFNLFTELLNITLKDKYSKCIKECADWCMHLCLSIPKYHSFRIVLRIVCMKKHEQYRDAKPKPPKIEYFRYFKFISELFNQDLIDHEFICSLIRFYSNYNKQKYKPFTECCILLKYSGNKLDN